LQAIPEAARGELLLRVAELQVHVENGKGIKQAKRVMSYEVEIIVGLFGLTH